MGEEWLRRGRSERGEGEGDIIIKDEVGKKLKRGKMRATRIIETLSRIVVFGRVKLRQLLRLSRRHRRAACGGWLILDSSV